MKTATELAYKLHGELGDSGQRVINPASIVVCVQAGIDEARSTPTCADKGPAPDKLRIHAGRLAYMVDGVGVNLNMTQRYLEKWQVRAGVPDGTPVCLVTRRELNRLYMLESVLGGCA